MPTFTAPFGRKLTATVEFRNPDGELTDPTTVRWKLRPPVGEETTTVGLPPGSGATHPDTGTFTYSFTPSRSGRWVLRCEGLGAVEQAVEYVIFVEPSLLQTASVTP